MRFLIFWHSLRHGMTVDSMTSEMVCGCGRRFKYDTIPYDHFGPKEPVDG